MEWLRWFVKCRGWCVLVSWNSTSIDDISSSVWQRTIPTEFHTLKKKQTINWTQDSEVTSQNGYICPVLLIYIQYPDEVRIQVDTHEGFCSLSMLQEQSSSVCTNDFMGILLPWEQNFHPAKCSTIFNQLNIWEQAPRANWANLKALPGVYWHMQNETGACSGSKTPRVYRP